MKYLDPLSALVVVCLAAACDTAGKKMEQPTEQKQEEARESQLLEYAIFYSENGMYPDGLSKDKKRAVRKKAKSISIELGEVFKKKKNKKVSQHTHEYRM